MHMHVHEQNLSVSSIQNPLSSSLLIHSEAELQPNSCPCVKCSATNEQSRYQFSFVKNFLLEVKDFLSGYFFVLLLNLRWKIFFSLNWLDGRD